jgi:hypothetical protein
MPKTITKENAMQFVEMRRAMGKMGGRPKGVLSKTTIAKIKGKETFAEEVAKKAGLIAEGLFHNLIYKNDTSAGNALLDRAFGKVPQGVQMQVATFSLKELAEYRKSLANPQTEALPTITEALQDDQKDPQQEPTEKAE